MNGVDLNAWLTAKLIVEGHEQSKIQDLLPWNFVVSA